MVDAAFESRRISGDGRFLIGGRILQMPLHRRFAYSTGSVAQKPTPRSASPKAGYVADESAQDK